MTKKNWALAIILCLLIAVFGVLVGRKGPAGNVQIEKEIFAVADTAAIEKIVLQQAGGQAQTLVKQAGGSWQLNGKYAADPSIMQLMLSVLHQAQVKRPVARSQQEEVLAQLKENGVVVTLTGNGTQQFIAGGRESERISYFARDEEAYVMELPGYSSYISGIFFLQQGELRNKFLTSLNSMNFQQLDINYLADTAQNVSIRFQNNTLGVAGMARPDSSILFQYMMMYEPLEIAGYLQRGEDPAYDSLLAASPLAVFRMQTVGNAEGLTLQLFPPLQDRRYRLAYLPKQQEAVLLDERLAQAMLIRRADLMLK